MRLYRILLIGLVCQSGCAQRTPDVISDISGEWLISSTAGGQTPITVYCTLVQNGFDVSGSCIPEMANAAASELEGSVTLTSASWGYDVVFNGEPGRVEFLATTVSNDALRGTLSLSGTEAPFSAVKRD